MEVNINELQNIKFSSAKSSSLFIDNFIDNSYGKIKIYKAKKRLELRLRPKYWVDHNMTLNFDLNFHSSQVNIRNLIIEDKLEEYENEITRNIFHNSNNRFTIERI